MRPSELYKIEPKSVTADLSYLANWCWNFIPECHPDLLELIVLEKVKSKRVEIYIYKEWSFDVRRFWRLAGVFLDGKPVMITQNAGREGSDFINRYITDVATYQRLVHHLNSLLPLRQDCAAKVVSEQDDIQELTNFYGYSLDGHFDIY